MKSLLLFVLLLPLTCFSQEGNGGDKTDYWDGPRVTTSDRPLDYTAAMHNRFPSIKSNYEENGAFYYSNTVNSFGFKEILNPQQEVIFCGAGDKTFSQAFMESSQVSVDNRYETVHSMVKHDSSTISPSPDGVQNSIRQALINNSNSTAKGRFCYAIDDPTVSYRQSGAENEVFCESGQQMTYGDPVSGFSCRLELDVPLKVGETRFIRQLQNGMGTIAQGFVGCYANPANGVAEVSLVENPDGCSPSNRDECIRTCDWADEVVCDPRDMPRWGGGKCGAYGTVMFKGDVLDVLSSEQLSYDEGSGTLYEGDARMACQLVNGVAEWVVTQSSCSPVSD